MVVQASQRFASRATQNLPWRQQGRRVPGASVEDVHGVEQEIRYVLRFVTAAERWIQYGLPTGAVISFYLGRTPVIGRRALVTHDDLVCSLVCLTSPRLRASSLGSTRQAVRYLLWSSSQHHGVRFSHQSLLIL